MGIFGANIKSGSGGVRGELGEMPISSKGAEVLASPPRDWSPYQTRVFDWISKRDGNLVVEATAGSGKTATIEECCKRLPGTARVLFLAFNKSIAEELQSRIGGRAECRTLNSVGYALLRRAVPGLELGERAAEDAIKAELKGVEKEYQLRFGAKKALSVLKAFALPSDSGLEGMLDREQKRMGLGLKKEEMAAGLGAFRKGFLKSGKIDFDDQIYGPVLLNATPPEYDWIFVDECQDLSPNQIRLVLLLAGSAGRVVCVGDRFQSIYGFRGASTNAMDNLRIALNAASLPLSITYRCPESVVALAQRFCPSIEAREGAPQGSVKRGKIGRWKGAGEGELVLCRVTADLVLECLLMVSNFKRARVLGRDIGVGIARLVEDAAKGADGMPAKEVVARAREAAEGKAMFIIDQGGSEAAAAGWLDRASCVLALSKRCRTAGEMRKAVGEMFEAGAGDSMKAVSPSAFKGATFSTVHKAKGLEAETVSILRSELMPHPRAQNDYEMEQEGNIEYVAITRARNALRIVSGSREDQGRGRDREEFSGEDAIFQ